LYERLLAKCFGELEQFPARYGELPFCTSFVVLCKYPEKSRVSSRKFS
jgi:hypothetical protein